MNKKRKWNLPKIKEYVIRFHTVFCETMTSICLWKFHNSCVDLILINSRIYVGTYVLSFRHFLPESWRLPHLGRVCGQSSFHTWVWNVGRSDRVAYVRCRGFWLLKEERLIDKNCVRTKSNRALHTAAGRCGTRRSGAGSGPKANLASWGPKRSPPQLTTQRLSSKDAISWGCQIKQDLWKPIRHLHAERS